MAPTRADARNYRLKTKKFVMGGSVRTLLVAAFLSQGTRHSQVMTQAH